MRIGDADRHASRTVRLLAARRSARHRLTNPCQHLERWLVVLLALVFASATLLHEGAHADAAHPPQDVNQSAVDPVHDDCDQDRDHAAKGESCAALTVCKICVPVTEITALRFGSSIRHSWIGDSFTALLAAPNRKPPKLIVRS